MAEEDTLRAELEQTKKRADMLISGHNLLTEKYSFKSRLITLGIIIPAIFLLMFAWVQESWLVNLAALVGFRLTPDIIKFSLGVAAFLNLCLVIWDLVEAPRTQAELHKKAVAHYIQAKYNIQQVLGSEHPITDQLNKAIMDEYLDSPIQLEENYFLLVKKHHLIKRHLSQLLDKRPHAWILGLRLKYWWQDTFCPSTKIERSNSTMLIGKTVVSNNLPPAPND